MASQEDGRGDRDFMLAEHACLQEKIRHASTDLYRTETIIPLAIAVFYAWLLGAESTDRIPTLLMWVPVIMVLYGMIRQFLRYQSLRDMHEYVRDLERITYGSSRPTLGWETRWLAKTGHWRGHVAMRSVFWVILLVLTARVAWQLSSGVAAPPLQESLQHGRQISSEIEMSGIDISVIATIIIAVLSMAFSVGSIAYTAHKNLDAKVREIDGSYKAKLIELAVSTANSEFINSQQMLADLKVKPRPMSLYVIFHFVLFRNLDTIGKTSSAAKVLESTFREVIEALDAYAESGIEEFGLVWNIQRPDRMPPTGDTLIRD